jgi:hypothetical protein
MLILEVDERHWILKLKQRAHDLNVKLAFVPAGGTLLYQRLD